MRANSIVLAGLSLCTLLAACGGPTTTAEPSADQHPAPALAATGFAYTDPVTTGWALVRSASSTTAHLVLDLVGPPGLEARGVGFNLASDGSVKFHKFEDGQYVRDLGVFQLKLAEPNLYTTKYPDLFQPVLIAAGTKRLGKLLTVGIFQKDRTQPAQKVNAPLLQIGIDLPSIGGPAAGADVKLELVRARIIPADLGTMPDTLSGDWSSVIRTFHLDDIEIAVGRLQAI